MVKIKKQLINDTPNKYGKSNGKKFITVHQTGNTSKGADAKTHANLQSNGNSRNAAWHYQVDDKQAVQSFTHNFQLWQSGDGRGDGNLNSISVESCVNSDADYKKTVENTAELVKYIMEQENISIENVVQHNKWSGKNCPAQIRANKAGIGWAQFIAMVQGKTYKPSKYQTKPDATIKPYTQDAKYPKLENYGTNVLKIQKLLNKAGYKVSEDSSFGPATDKAVRRFQKDNGLAVDGQAGPATQKALNGSTGANLSVDGSWGSDTTRALQRYFKTTVDGVISGQPKNQSTQNIPSAKYGTTGSNLIRAMQRHYKSGVVDGVISGKSNLITAMQRKYGLSIIDGRVSFPSNLVKEIQRRLNNDTL